MSIETVNGYVCTNCAEAAMAKRGINPQGESEQPGAAQKSGATEALKPGENNAEVLDPRAVLGTAEAERARAPLSYSQNLDKLA